MAVPGMSKCPRLTDPLVFCSCHSPAPDCLCCCTLQNPSCLQRGLGVSKGKPGSASLVSKADNFIPCHGSRPSSVS